MAQMVKTLPTVQETRAPPLGGEDPLEKGMAAQPSLLAWGIPWTQEPGSTVPGLAKSPKRLSD